MTPEYFYTINLGEGYGRKLETLLARQAAFDDVEEFAGFLLRLGIDQFEKDEENREKSGNEDDGIPF